MSDYLNTRIEQTGVGTSAWLLLGSNKRRGAKDFSIAFESGGDTASIEVTIDATTAEITGDTVPTDEVHVLPNGSALTAKALLHEVGPIKAIRINQTLGAGTTALTVLDMADEK